MLFSSTKLSSAFSLLLHDEGGRGGHERIIGNAGSHFPDHIIKGERGSGKICLNGAAARKVQPGDIVIIMSYALMDFEEAKQFKPSIVFPDPATNSVVK